MVAISRLLSPRSVAVVGASADPSKTSGRPVSYLVKHGFSGDIYPVNPKVNRIGELPCYPDIASIPGVPDVGKAGFGSLSPAVLRALPAPAHEAIVHAFGQALPPIFLFAVPIIVVAVVLSLFIRETPLSETVGGSAE